MVGLERGTVELEPYQDTWPVRYEAEVERLTGLVGDRVRTFEHIGSTAIEGLPAKPIIDILAVVADLADAPAIVDVLEAHGYERRPDDVAGRVFLAKGPRTNRTVYLSIAAKDSRFHTEQVAFRDYLRTHPDARERYAALKRRLAAQYPDDRERYTAAKGDFVQEILAAALDE